MINDITHPVILARKYSAFRKIACALTRPFEYNRDAPHEKANVESSFCMHGINRAACFEFARFCREQRKFPPTPSNDYFALRFSIVSPAFCPENLFTYRSRIEVEFRERHRRICNGP